MKFLFITFIFSYLSTEERAENFHKKGKVSRKRAPSQKRKKRLSKKNQRFQVMVNGNATFEILAKGQPNACSEW